MTRLVLTLTRECNCRCSYCPTRKDGAPTLGVADARRAVELLATRYGGGEVQLTGGEPLLVPEVVRAVLDEARARPEIRRVQLCTNGLLLTPQQLDELLEHDKALLFVSLDGRPEHHRLHRVALAEGEDSYEWLTPLLPALTTARRLVVTQTVAPATAAMAAENFDHLLSMGFSRFKLLPVYYRPWLPEQIDELRRSFAVIGERIRQRWTRAKPLYLANLFTLAPTPLFNTGLVVDSDGSVHASNAGLAAACEQLLAHTKVGTLSSPPSVDALRTRAASVPHLLQQALPEQVWQSTQSVDAELTCLCRSLYADFLAHRGQRRASP